MGFCHAALTEELAAAADQDALDVNFASQKPVVVGHNYIAVSPEVGVVDLSLFVGVGLVL